MIPTIKFDQFTPIVVPYSIIGTMRARADIIILYRVYRVRTAVGTDRGVML